MTNPYILGLDLDNVSAKYTEGLRDFVAKETGFPVAAFPEPFSYDFEQSGWDLSAFGGFRNAHEAAVEDGLFTRLMPMEGIRQALWNLDAAGVHIRIVTHRFVNHGSHARVISDTAVWLDRMELPYRSICFTGLKDSVGSHSFVDDAPSNISSLRAAGIHTFVFDHLYNRDFDGPRIFNWTDGEEKILQHKQSIGL